METQIRPEPTTLMELINRTPIEVSRVEPLKINFMDEIPTAMQERELKHPEGPGVTLEIGKCIIKSFLGGFGMS